MYTHKYFFYLIILLGIISRIFAISLYGDAYIGMEWGEIFSAYKKYGIIGREINGQVVPNLYMPPLYPIFLIILDFFYPFKKSFPLFVLYTQLILSIISLFYLRKILKMFFSNNLSLIGVLIFTLLPINIYSVAQSSSVSLQLFLLIIFFYYFLIFCKNENFKNSIIFAIPAALLILIRGEFLLTYILTLTYIFILNKKIKYLLVGFIISFIIISPYVLRNYEITNKVVITESFGFNLWKGNNLLSKVEGNDKIYKEQMKNDYENLNLDQTYDIEMDKIYKVEAIENISTEPYRYLKLYIKKFFSYMFFDLDSSRSHYFNPFHILPKIILSLASFFGLIYLLKSKKIGLNYFAYFYIYNIALFSIFFILPRYSLMLLPAQIILICFLIQRLKPDI